MTTAFLTTRVAEVITETPRINRYRLVSNDGALPGFEAGAHIDVVCPDGQLRQYSLCNEPSECPEHYEFAVLREDNGRGGSFSLHQGLSAESTLSVGVPRNHFQLQPATGRTLLLAGGIGITPREAYVTADVSIIPLAPPWLFLLLASTLLVGAWLREGRR